MEALSVTGRYRVMRAEVSFMLFGFGRSGKDWARALIVKTIAAKIMGIIFQTFVIVLKSSLFV